MVKSFLNETKIGNKSKNRVRKEKKKKTCGGSEETAAIKRKKAS